ncbi:diguanylate cyclase (GGDEF)-like protein [Deinococcus metalli]|uniref:Diguanylate cyclase (GGDEF)-like protein n=1 Tax=Deinococcus metalli TaxID=1141878 RepID=A0A7W8KJC2_9DEIO|nr:GGDEF domain-containing protein [Deinococcus metalli]MBB5378960.1 diguanylate cyclase (GGDEF)-like protein [Deinococcus metalli]GHF63026.1 GGDEF domain-containing protein [Deinococcus metalli]
MTPGHSPLEQRLSQIRLWIVVIANLSYLLYCVLTTLIGAEPFTLEAALTGDHRTRYWGGLLAAAGLLAVWAWPRRVRVIYLPYLLTLLGVSVAEVLSTVSSRTMPFHLALWLSANMAIVFLVYGARRGVQVFGAILGVIVAALAVHPPDTRDMLADWITTLIVMAVAGASSALLMTLIESNMLIHERTIDELRTARIDAVTGMPGRAVTEHDFERLLGHARTTRQPLGVIVTDIDHFKTVNDEHGHRRGDEVLREFAARLVTHVAPHHGTVGRWGGEEFLVLLPDHDYAQTHAVAQAMCRSVNERAVAGVTITASFGVSCLEEPLASAEALFTDADSALYEAKRTGRNKVA